MERGQQGRGVSKLLDERGLGDLESEIPAPRLIAQYVDDDIDEIGRLELPRRHVHPDDEPRRQTLTQALAADLARYVDFVWDHLGREEGVILPAARRVLSAGDWAAIDASFAAAAAAADAARPGTPAADLARILALAADTGPV